VRRVYRHTASAFPPRIETPIKPSLGELGSTIVFQPKRGYPASILDFWDPSNIIIFLDMNRPGSPLLLKPSGHGPLHLIVRRLVSFYSSSIHKLYASQVYSGPALTLFKTFLSLGFPTRSKIVLRTPTRPPVFLSCSPHRFWPMRNPSREHSFSKCCRLFIPFFC
jgi:hypothetical protein